MYSPTPQPQEIQQVDTSKNVGPTPQPQEMQQVDTLNQTLMQMTSQV